jgi:hypothetical protein
MTNLETINTKDLCTEIISRGAADTDNEGQYIIYTGIYEEDSE